MYVTGPAALLPSAEPGGTVPQLGPVDVNARVVGSGTPQAPSVKKETEPVHELPIGAEQEQGEQVRVSST